MNQSESLIAETTISFSQFKDITGIVEKKISWFENTRTYSVNAINNHLKTPEEMDADFFLEMNTNKLMFREHPDFFDTYGRIVKNAIESNVCTSDGIPSGFMEENY